MLQRGRINPLRLTHCVLRTTQYVIFLTLLSSCVTASPSSPVFPPFILVTQDPNASPTPTPFQPAPSGEAPPPTATLPATETPAPSPTSTDIPTPLPATDTPAETAFPPVSTPSHTNYILYATLDFINRTVSVEETIRYYNTTGAALSEVVLSIQPNRYGNCFSLQFREAAQSHLQHMAHARGDAFLHLWGKEKRHNEKQIPVKGKSSKWKLMLTCNSL